MKREEYELRMKNIKNITGAIAPMNDYIESLESKLTIVREFINDNRYNMDEEQFKRLMEVIK